MNLLLKIISEVSLWYFLLIIPIVVYLVLYFYKNDISLGEMPIWAKKISKTLRTLAIILSLLLLLSPLFQWFVTEVKKPVVVIAVDNSQSVSISNLFPQQKIEIEAFISDIKKKYSEYFNLQFYSFGSNVQPLDSLMFNDNRTNISAIIQHVQNEYEFENLGALILISDGNYNTGQNPLYLNQALPFPIYTVPLGDTTTQADVYIEKLLYNPHQFLGNNIRIQANIKANLLSGKKTQVKLYRNNDLIDKIPLNITSNQFYSTVSFTIFEEKTGIYKYTIAIDSTANEFLYQNNEKTAVIHISDQKQNIAIVSSFPHPDVGVLLSSLETNPSFNVYISQPEKIIDSLHKLHAIILYQIPNLKTNSSLLLKSISEKQIPTLFILGTQSDFNSFNQLFYSQVIIQPKASQFEYAYMNLNLPDNLFNLSNDLKETFELFPPLYAPFGTYKLPENSEIIAYQRIKQIETTIPLVAFSEWQQNNKCGIIFGEGIFRWRMSEYFHKQQHTYLNTFLNKMMLYLLSKQKRERFIVRHKTIYNDGEVITLDAELYNKIYEPISDANIVLQLESKSKDIYQFTFEKNQPFYSLNIRSLPEGEYKWKAIAQLQNEKLVKQGVLVVKENNLELQEYHANINLLKQLAIRTNGKFVQLDSLNILPELLTNNPNIVSTSYSTEKFLALIDIHLVLILIVILISIEWFLRKFFGSL